MEYTPQAVWVCVSNREGCGVPRSWVPLPRGLAEQAEVLSRRIGYWARDKGGPTYRREHRRPSLPTARGRAGDANRAAGVQSLDIDLSPASQSWAHVSGQLVTASLPGHVFLYDSVEDYRLERHPRRARDRDPDSLRRH